jgi:hypothetical protein
VWIFAVAIVFVQFSAPVRPTWAARYAAHFGYECRSVEGLGWCNVDDLAADSDDCGHLFRLKADTYSD